MADIRERFGVVLKAWRTEKHYTQEELAERSGLSYKFIGEIERGAGNPTIETVSQLAVALGIEIVDFFKADRPDRMADEAYRLSKRDIQTVREATESLDSVMRHLTANPAARYHRRRRPKP